MTTEKLNDRKEEKIKNFFNDPGDVNFNSMLINAFDELQGELSNPKININKIIDRKPLLKLQGGQKFIFLFSLLVIILLHITASDNKAQNFVNCECVRF